MKQEEFDKYMESYKKLTLLEKQDIIVKQLKILASFTNSLCKEIGADNNIMINKGTRGKRRKYGKWKEMGKGQRGEAWHTQYF